MFLQLGPDVPQTASGPSYKNMKDRKSSIITGCNFIKGLVIDGKTQSNIFKKAVDRLKKLLDDEVQNLPEGEDTLFEQAKKVFETK